MKESALNILIDILTALKLFLFAFYCSVETLVKNLFIPRSLLEKSIKNQVVLITGAAGGIGQNVVVNLLKLECKLICIDQNQEALDKLKERLNLEFNEKYNELAIFYYNIDVTSTQQIRDCLQRIEKDIKQPVDILINSVGLFNKGKLFVELTEKEINNIFNVNVFSYMWLIRELLPGMIERNKGHIVNLCSSLGQFGAYRVSDYCATKFAVAGFTESLRIELKSTPEADNVKVTLVCPYHVNTDLFKGFEMNSFEWASVAKNDPEKVAKAITDGIVLEKELVGYPTVQFYVFLAIKNLMTTRATDCMMIWFGFNEAIIQTYNAFIKNE